MSDQRADFEAATREHVESSRREMELRAKIAYYRRVGRALLLLNQMEGSAI